MMYWIRQESIFEVQLTTGKFFKEKKGERLVEYILFVSNSKSLDKLWTTWNCWRLGSKDFVLNAILVKVLEDWVVKT